jgi:hypothetical protein
LTAVAPVKLVPVIVTEVPTGPDVGVKPVIVGTELVVTVNDIGLVARPLPVSTVMVPDVVPAGTVAVTLVAETTE